MTVRKKTATKKVTQRVSKAAKVQLANTALMEAVTRSGEKAAAKAKAKQPKARTAFAPNLMPRVVNANVPAGTMMVLAQGQPAVPGARTVTLLSHSSPPAPTGTAATKAAGARGKASGTTK